jgi:hypothetical protein
MINPQHTAAALALKEKLKEHFNKYDIELTGDEMNDGQLDKLLTDALNVEWLIGAGKGYAIAEIIYNRTPIETPVPDRKYDTSYPGPNKQFYTIDENGKGTFPNPPPDIPGGPTPPETPVPPANERLIDVTIPEGRPITGMIVVAKNYKQRLKLFRWMWNHI